MAGEFHPGELEIQERAGVRAMARKIGGSIHETIPPAAGAFLAQRTFVVLSTADADTRPWASVLSGAPGFAHAIDDRAIRVEAVPLPGDPLADNVKVSRFAGLIAPDLAARRRLRLNGALEIADDGALVIRADQVYSNCPKYIQRRGDATETAEQRPELVRRATSLSEEQCNRIRRADTFFIATLNPDTGADASHRGGIPGFVAVEGDRLVWPDYSGNSMFNTLGNIAVHPRAGLLFPDFERGSILQLTGGASIEWDIGRVGAITGAERLVEVEVEEVVEIAGALPPLQLVDYSPFNPR